MQIQMSILIIFSAVFALSLPAHSQEVSLKSDKEGLIVMKDPDFIKFRGEIIQCLNNKSVACLMNFTHERDPRSFAVLMPDLGDETEIIHCAPDRDYFSAKEVYECLFRPEGKNLLRGTRQALDTQNGIILTSTDYESDGKKFKFSRLTTSDRFSQIWIRKINGKWRIIGIHA